MTIEKLENESLEQYKERVYFLYYQKKMQMQDVMDLLSPFEKHEHTISKYKHEYKDHYKAKFEQLMTSFSSEPEYEEEYEQEVSQEDELRNLLAEIKKERIKLSDERTQNNAFIRRLSREENIIEIAKNAAEKLSTEKELEPFSLNSKDFTISDVEGILLLSDWHYGMTVNSYFNRYSPEICTKRVQKLQDKVIKKCLNNGVRNIRIVNLSDLIAGRIHLPIRLQSRIDVITQIMEVSELLAEFIHNLSEHFTIDYYDCTDNHSRLEPNISDSLDLESLTRITHWFLENRFQEHDKIIIHSNEVSEDIITFTCKGHKIIAVHGDKDKSPKVIDNLNSFTQDHHDLILSAHEHHFSGDEKNQSIRLSSGTLMGSDDYSEKLRLTSQPSQLLILVSEENVTEDICRIVLD